MNRIKLTWSTVYCHAEPAGFPIVYDSAGAAWCENPVRGALRAALIRQNGDGSETWTPGGDEYVWIDPPPLSEPPDGTRIEFEYGTDVYGAWRDDKASAEAGYEVGDGGEVWCLFGSSVPRSWVVMWLEFGDSLATAVRLVPVPEDVPNYERWLTAQMARGEVRSGGGGV